MSAFIAERSSSTDTRSKTRREHLQPRDSAVNEKADSFLFSCHKVYRVEVVGLSLSNYTF